MPLFRKSDKTPAVPLTAAQRAAGHRRRAELMKVGGAGHDQMTRVAAQATAHATLAISYQLMPEPAALIGPDDEDDEST